MLKIKNNWQDMASDPKCITGWNKPLCAPQLSSTGWALPGCQNGAIHHFPVILSYHVEVVQWLGRAQFREWFCLVSSEYSLEHRIQFNLLKGITAIPGGTNERSRSEMFAFLPHFLLPLWEFLVAQKTFSHKETQVARSREKNNEHGPKPLN